MNRRSDNETRTRKGAYTKTALVVEAIRDKILGHSYVPGEHLTEQMLIEDSENASRTSVRLALPELQRQGLLTIEANKGARVANVTKEDLNEIHDARLGLELHVVRQLAECPNVRLQSARQINERLANLMREAVGLSGEKLQTMGRESANLDLDFHVELSRLAGFANTYGPWLELQRNRFRVLARPNLERLDGSTVSEHNRILDAITEARMELAQIRAEIGKGAEALAEFQKASLEDGAEERIGAAAAQFRAAKELADAVESRVLDRLKSAIRIHLTNSMLRWEIRQTA